MNDTLTLEQVIRQFIPLPNRANTRGFYPVLCKVCNDHGRKGDRAGFKFDGDIVGYNCFNCGHTARYDPAENESMPGRMVEVLRSFGIMDVDWSPVLFSSLLYRLNHKTAHQSDRASPLFDPTEIELPACAVPLTDDDNEWNQYAIEYLKDERSVDWKDHQFFIVNEITTEESKKWYGRLIIPIYKGNKLIYFQGRDLSGTRTKKYLNPIVDRDNVIHGFDLIRDYSPSPLYIVEGWFDAAVVNGIAVFGNHLSQNQVRWVRLHTCTTQSSNETNQG